MIVSPVYLAIKYLLQAWCLGKISLVIFYSPLDKKNPKDFDKIEDKKSGMNANAMTVEPSDYLATY